jgi:hypothetical protein
MTFQDTWRNFVRVDFAELPVVEKDYWDFCEQLDQLIDKFIADKSYALEITGGAVDEVLAREPMVTGSRDYIVKHIAEVIDQAEGEWLTRQRGDSGTTRSQYLATAVMDHLWREHPLGH